MTVFDYPRLNFRGHLRLNPGTANNEDYAQPGGQQALMPPSFGHFAGKPMALLESSPVHVQRYGLDDAAFVTWIQSAQEFDTPASAGARERIVPAEWNYYGDMSSAAADITVLGVQTGPGRVHTEVDGAVPLTRALGATLSFFGNITDVNPEGSPPATQFFVDGLELTAHGERLIHGGRTSKGVGLWINYYRNVNLVADDGSGTYVQHVVTGATVDLPGLAQADGVLLRYYLSLPLLDDPTTRHEDVLEQYYRDARRNPKTLDIVGTLAPYHEGEPIAMPPGRQLISRTQNIGTAPNMPNNGAGNGIALAPAVACETADQLTVDFVGSFPEAFAGRGRENPKYDFGEVTLRVVRGAEEADLGVVPYADTTAGDQRGWLFDFDLSTARGRAAREMLSHQDARLELHSPGWGSVLSEVDFYVVTDELAVYAEQGGPDDAFLSQGVLEPLRVSVYHRGEKMDPSPPITMWEYRTVPIQAPGDATRRTSHLAAGEAITVATDHAGAVLLTFLVNGETNPRPAEFPPANYADFAYPPAAFAVTWAPSISVRILPSPDYSRYYVNPEASVPVANESLTWDVVYSEVLRTYALLYPAMNNKIVLSDEAAVAEFAPYIVEATDPRNWMSSRFMPPTRDLSESRRRLLVAWCNKVSAPRTPE